MSKNLRPPKGWQPSWDAENDLQLVRAYGSGITGVVVGVSPGRWRATCTLRVLGTEAIEHLLFRVVYTTMRAACKACDEAAAKRLERL